MGYFAEVKTNGIVSRVIVTPPGADDQWCASRYGGTWKETSISASFRGMYAGPGHCYNEGADTFVRPSLTLIGDSIISFLGDSRASLGAPFSNATYLAKGGDTLVEISNRVPSIPANTTHVLPNGGTNNLLGLGTNAGILPGYATIFETVPTGMRIIVLGIPQVDEVAMEAAHPGWTFWLNNALIAEENAKIAALCNTYANCTPALGVMNMSAVGLTTDGIHHTLAGKQAYAAAIRPYLQ